MVIRSASTDGSKDAKLPDRSPVRHAADDSGLANSADRKASFDDTRSNDCWTSVSIDDATSSPRPNVDSTSLRRRAVASDR